MVEVVTVAVIGIVAVILIAIVVLMQWMEGGWCYSKAQLVGKTVIITGSNTGIGKETAKDLAKRGARVIMACRNLEKAKEAHLEVVRTAGHRNVVIKQLDLSSLKSVREFAEEIKKEEKRVDILLNNAGIMICPDWKTEDGFDMQLGTNYLGHFLLTHLLLDLLKASAPSRVVNVSSMAHIWGKIHWDDINMTKNYNSMEAYNQSKLANILFSRELAKRLEGTGVNTYSLHPGGVATDLQRHADTPGIFVKYFLAATRPFFKTPEQGAQTNIYCCVDDQAGMETGLYYSDCKVKKPAKQALDDEAAKRLWDLSLKLVGLDE